MRFAWYTFLCCGEMAERFMALVLKTSDPARDRGFESLSLRHLFSQEASFLGQLLKAAQGVS